ncbi:hypothetical protein R1flu_003573 [Riccia fluitans]|uniref:Uncharacterized protein n=1 Tax=Riccia fluitans TaxID=41844 RepID=A0ABD1Y9D6_9MARC
MRITRITIARRAARSLIDSTPNPVKRLAVYHFSTPFYPIPESFEQFSFTIAITTTGAIALPSLVGDVTPPKEKASVQGEFWDEEDTTTAWPRRPAVWRPDPDAEKLGGCVARATKNGPECQGGLWGHQPWYVACATYVGWALLELDAGERRGLGWSDVSRILVTAGERDTE